MGSLPNLDVVTELLDPDTFSHESKAVVDFLADYYRGIEKYPVRSEVEPGYLQHHLPTSAPYYPTPMSSILADVRECIMPGITHWQSPNFYAYFPASASTAAFAGEMLCSGLSVVGFNWLASPAATELEAIVMDWMGKLLGLPKAFLFEGRQGGGGILYGTTCEAVLCTMAAARDRALEAFGGHEGILKLVVYASDQTHCTFQKAAKLAGIPPANFRCIPTDASTGYALTADRVGEAMEADVAKGLIPFYLCATIGTTGLGAVDPIEDLGHVAKRHGVWLHVDAAYAGTAAVCPEFRQYFRGVELADSVSTNLHKWLLANIDTCCMWIRNSGALVSSLSTNPEYLRNEATEAGGVVDYKDWQMALSRRFRSIKLWVVLQRYGSVLLQDHIRDDVEMAKRLEKKVRDDPRFEIVLPRKFALVCFRLKHKNGHGHRHENLHNGRSDRSNWKQSHDLNERLLDAVNSTGKAFITHTTADGSVVLRMAVGATLTEERHVNATWELIKEKAESILAQDAEEAYHTN